MMDINTRLKKQILNAVEFFYDNSYKRTELDEIYVLGQSRLLDHFKLKEMAEEEATLPVPFEDLIDPQIVAVSQRQEYVVVFGVGATYTSGSYTNNAFALVNMSGRRPLVKRFIVGEKEDTKINLLKKHLDPRKFQQFNDRALKKDLREENLNHMQLMDEEAHSEANRYDDEFDEAYDQYEKIYEEIEYTDPDDGEYSRWKALGLTALKKEIKKLSERLDRLNTERALLNLSSETY